MPAEFRRPHRAPDDAVARIVEAAERAGETLRIRQQVLLRHHRAVEHDLAGDRGAQAELAFDRRRRETLGAALDQEAADDAVELRPHHRDVGDRGVRDPHLVAGQPVAVGDLLGPRRHRAGVGAVVGLGQAEAAEHFAGRELRQIFAALRLGAVGIDRVHHQRRLHRHHRAVAGIDTFHFTGNEPVADVAEAGAAVLLRDGGAEEPERAHLVDDLAIEALLAIGGEHARKQLVLGVAVRGVAHHALVGRQFAFEIERVLPVERRIGRRFCRFSLAPGLTPGARGFRHGRCSSRSLNGPRAVQRFRPKCDRDVGLVEWI